MTTATDRDAIRAEDAPAQANEADRNVSRNASRAETPSPANPACPGCRPAIAAATSRAHALSPANPATAINREHHIPAFAAATGRAQAPNPANPATPTSRPAFDTAPHIGHDAIRAQAPADHAPAPFGTATHRPQAPSQTGTNRRQFLHLAAVGIPALRAAEPGFRFALIGDRTGTAAPQIYSRVWREVSLFGPDLAISIGDIIQGGSDATAVKEWREMDDIWRRYRRFPTYFVPGNHDIWSAESKRLFEIEAGHPATHSFVHGGALFVILDNSLTDALPPGQLEYCERTLARHRDLRPKFVFCHRPSWLLDARVGNRNFGLHTLARKYGVDYVISGHGHQLVHLELDGVRYLEIGSSGGSIERGLRLGQGFKEGWFYHWIWAQVRDGKVEFTVKEVTGLGRVFRLSDWGATGPKFDPGDPALLDTPRL